MVVSGLFFFTVLLCDKTDTLMAQLAFGRDPIDALPVPIVSVKADKSVVE